MPVKTETHRDIIPHPADVLPILLAPRIEVIAQPAKKGKEPWREAEVQTRTYREIHEELTEITGISYGEFANIGFNKRSTHWREIRLGAPGSRDPKVFIGTGPVWRTEAINNRVQMRVEDPVGTGVTSILIERETDNTKPNSTKAIHVAGLHTRGSATKPTLRYRRTFAHESQHELDEQNETLEPTTVYVSKTIESHIEEQVDDIKIVAVKYGAENDFALTTGLISLSTAEYHDMQRVIEEFGIEDSMLNLFAYLPQNDPEETPGITTSEMARQSHDSAGILFQQAPDGNVYFGTLDPNWDNNKFSKIQKAVTGLGYKIQKTKGNKITVSRKPKRVAQDVNNKWRVSLPAQLGAITSQG